MDPETREAVERLERGLRDEIQASAAATHGHLDGRLGESEDRMRGYLDGRLAESEERIRRAAVLHDLTRA